MKVTKTELKNLIKECYEEILKETQVVEEEVLTEKELNEKYTLKEFIDALSELEELEKPQTSVAKKVAKKIIDRKKK